jgi:hypothetical protein
MERIDAAGTARVLAVVLDQPQAAESIFSSLGSVDGLTYEPGSPRRLWRAGVPPRLTVGDWQFDVVERSTALRVRHTVRGVVLSRSELPAGEAAEVLARALSDVAGRRGQATTDALAGLLGAWAELSGVPDE